MLRKFINLLPYLVIFFLMLFNSLDYDLGWHLKYGEHFINTGHLITKNTFSTMMPNFEWVSTSWGVDIITYIIFSNWGFLGISIGGALIAALTFYFFSKATRLDFIHKALIFPIVYIFTYPVFVVSFRGQLISILGTGILLYLTSLYDLGKRKYLVLTVPLILIWSNLHAQFVTGYAIFGIWITMQSISIIRNKTYKQLKYIWIILFLSGVITSINPAGIERYSIIIAHLIDPVINHILEYSPFEIFSKGWWFLTITGFVLILSILILYRQKQLSKKIVWLTSILIFYPISFTVKRYIWTMYFLTFPFLKSIIDLFKPKSQKLQVFIGLMSLVIFASIVFITDNPFSRIRSLSWSTYCQNINCPEKALRFLQNNGYFDNQNTKLLNFYTWGGFMIWHYPNIRPAIDGRMPLWRDKQGYSAFETYLKIEHGIIDINKTEYNLVLISPTRPIYTNLMLQTSEGNWKVIYKDDIAYIFERIK